MALEALDRIEPGDVNVVYDEYSGGKRYIVTFTGRLSRIDWDKMEMDPSGLSGGTGRVWSIPVDDGNGNITILASEVHVSSDGETAIKDEVLYTVVNKFCGLLFPAEKHRRIIDRSRPIRISCIHTTNGDPTL